VVWPSAATIIPEGLVSTLPPAALDRDEQPEPTVDVPAAEANNED
jgi:hypothetical protein